MSWLSSIIGGGKSAEHQRSGGKAAGPAESTLRVIIDHKDYPVAELAVRSFRILPYNGDLIVKQSFGFTMILNSGGEELKTVGRGVVRALSDKDGLVAQFTAPSPAFDKKLMEHLARTTSQNRAHVPGKGH